MPSVMTMNLGFLTRCSAVVSLVVLFLAATAASAQVPLTQISTDTFTNTTSQHATEVEPASFTVGSTTVSIFQMGRFTDGGASDIGFSTSTNGGVTWTQGNLPGITKLEGTGIYDRASDASVTYNLKFKVWLAEVLALSERNGPHGAAVLVSSSTDGITWSNPATVSVASSSGFYDKPWIGCDNHATSPHYGNCYVEWDDFSQFDLIKMSTSTDGGNTWSPKKSTAGSASGNGGIPLVQPNGTVIVPIDDPFLSSVLAFKSTDGGTTWTAPVTVAFISEHGVAGGMRALPLINAAMDAKGKVYVVWADCSFRTNCTSNDIVMSTSTDGTTWTPVVRIPIDPVSGKVDHFTPGLGLKQGTSGTTARLGLTYNFFPNASCTSNCNLSVGFIASANGGTTWNAAKTLANGMNPNWLPSTTSGQMVGDYMTATFTKTGVHGVFSDAKAPVGSTLKEGTFTNTGGLADAEDGPQFSSANDRPVPNAHSDHPKRTTPYVDNGRD